MHSVSTQTDISTVSAKGFNTWCVENPDIVDNIPSIQTLVNIRKRMLEKNFPTRIIRDIVN